MRVIGLNKQWPSYLNEFFEWKCSGHPDIMDYIIQPFRENIDNPEKRDLEPVENENMFAGLLRYNREHAALVFAVRTNWLFDKVKSNPKRESK